MLTLSARLRTDETFRSAALDAFRNTHAEESTRDHAELEQLALANGYLRSRIVHSVVDLSALVKDVETNLFYAAQRLRGRDDSVYDDYDRGQAEGAFRITVAPPLAGLFMVLAVRSSAWWWLGLVLAVILSYVGVEARTQGERQLGWAMAAGRVDDPLLQRFDVIDIAIRQRDENAGPGAQRGPASGGSALHG